MQKKGKPSTGIVVYSALLWLYDLLQPLEELADPLRDKEGPGPRSNEGAHACTQERRPEQ